MVMDCADRGSQMGRWKLGGEVIWEKTRMKNYGMSYICFQRTVGARTF